MSTISTFLTPHLFTFPGVLLSAVVASSALFFWQFCLASQYNSFSNLPGPKRDSLIFGNTKALYKMEPGEGHEALVNEFGPTLKYTGFMGTQRFFTADPKAVAHIMAHGYDYPKPERVRVVLKGLLGEGLVYAEGDDHRRVRKIMAHAFSTGVVRGMTETFFSYAYLLRDKMLEEIDETTTRTEMLKWLDKCTLDIIGDTGFGYRFNSLSSEDNKLADAFHDMWVTGSEMSLMVVLSSFFPILKKYFPTRSVLKSAIAMKTVEKIGTELVQSKKRAVLAALAQGEKGISVTKEDLHVGKDLLSTMIRANLATDVPLSQKISDRQLLGQISTFMVAGQETSATTIGWALYSLASNPEVQDRLREELLSVKSEAPVMEELVALPYLDAVVKETLRLYPAVSSTHREAGKDDMLPLLHPVTNTRNGRVMTEIPIKKGTSIFIPIINLNTLPSIWGPTSKQFLPSRWLMPDGIPASAHAVPGAYSHIATFVGGARSCIGYRFALAEVKAILFVLVKAFVFRHVDQRLEFEKKKYFVVIRPHVKGGADEGASLPLKVTPYIS